ncbi:unnamed protein product [Sphagnum troendelagicum]|uniref:Uncharacterized protein n=1 Tax=Sphagnum troendelagicum TaxID=128251 RepID=A0ABP0UFV5_9BRYO
MATKNFRVYKTSLRYTLHQQIPTLRQFHSEELRVGKRSSLQEQSPDVELQAQAPTNESTSAFQAVLESLQASMDGGQDVLDRERNKYSSKLGEGDAKQDIHFGEKLKCKYINVGLFFKGQDSAYPSNLRLPESSHTWSTEGSQPGNEMRSAPVRGKAIYHRRLRINTTPPEPNEQLHIVCQRCNLHPQVLQNLLKSDTGYQKLRCGACWKISCFQLYPSHSSPEHSPAGSKNISPLMSCQFSPDVSDGLSGSWRNPVILKAMRVPPQIVSTVASQAVNEFKTPEFNHGGREEFKGLREFLKRTVKDLTKSMSVSQLRHKVIINGHAVPDAVVMKLQDLAGPIHAGSYWYEFISFCCCVILKHLCCQ